MRIEGEVKALNKFDSQWLFWIETTQGDLYLIEEEDRKDWEIRPAIFQYTSLYGGGDVSADSSETYGNLQFKGKIELGTFYVDDELKDVITEKLNAEFEENNRVKS